MSLSIVRSFVSATLLLERRSNVRKLATLTRLITREIMKLVRASPAQTKKYKLGPFRWPLKLDPSHFEPDELEDLEGNEVFFVIVNIIRSNNIDDLDVSGYISPEELDDESVEGFYVHIVVPEKPSGEVLNTVWKQILETVRHEIEHLTQTVIPAYGRGEDYYRAASHPSPDNPKVSQYYLNKREIPAFVQGFIRRTRTRDKLSAAIKSSLARRAAVDWEKDPKEYFSPRDASTIHDVWMDWADRNVRTSKWKDRIP